MDLPIKYHEVHWSVRKRARLEYIKRQNGKCCHCGNDLDHPPHESVRCLPVDVTLFPVHFFKRPIHLHHDHNTGLTIGAVHCHCNAVLWQYHGE